MELTVYLGTKVHEQIRKPGSLSSPRSVLYPTLCPTASGAIPATFLSQERLACGGGKAQCPVFTVKGKDQRKAIPCIREF